jgi:uncharacterized protein
MNVFIFHGIYGNPEENWYPWLKEQLQEKGITVYAPVFPTPANQSLTSWFEALQPYEQFITEETIFVGHSLSCVFALHFLEQKNNVIQASFFVAPFIQPIGMKDIDALNATFYKKDFNWQTIQQHCPVFQLLYSTNDPYVSLPLAQEVATGLQEELILIENAGHFNEKAGYTKFNLLLTEILKLKT